MNIYLSILSVIANHIIHEISSDIEVLHAFKFFKTFLLQSNKQMITLLFCTCDTSLQFLTLSIYVIILASSLIHQLNQFCYLFISIICFVAII